MTPSNDQRAAVSSGNILPSIWLFAVTGSLLLGQFAATLPFFVAPELSLFLLTPLPLVLLRRCRGWTAVYLLTALAFAIGYHRHRQLLSPEFPQHHLRSIMGDKTELYLEGTLLHEPEKMPSRSRWYLRCERIWYPTGSQEIVGDLLVNVRHLGREWRYGDRIRAVLRPTVPTDSGNPGGFDYATFLAGRGIYATGYLDNDDRVQLVERAPNRWRGAIENLRRQMRGYLQSRFGTETGALIIALVVGEMGQIPKQMRIDFTAAGVNHVLSISGLHVAMLGLVVFWLVRIVGSMSSFLLLRCNLIKIATFCSFLAVVFYTALAGAMVPTVRSAIMIGVYELAVLLDREEEVLTSLTLAALLIALVWPAVIADISFQLSFIAVFSIAWGMRRFQTPLSPPPRDQLPQERSWLQPKLRAFSMHLAVPVLATIGTGPLIAHYFGHLSLVGFISNPIVVPLVGFVVVPLGLTIGFLSLVVPQFLGPVVMVCEWALWLTNWLVSCFSRLPLANISVPAPNAFEVIGLYLLLLSLLLFRRNRYAVVGILLAAIALTSDGVYWWRERSARSELRVTHLNVGQGDAAVVEFPGAKTLLIDAGGTASGEFDTGEAIVGPFLRHRKILKLDYLLVSHPRIDHYGGMTSIVKEFSPEEFWSGAARGRTRRFEELDEVLDTASVKRVIMNDQHPCRIIESVKVCILFPPSDRADDPSVVLTLEYGRVSFLFAGDIDGRDEQLLLHKAGISSTVLKVPRHGSASSSTPEFIGKVRPKLAVFSGDVRNLAAAKKEAVTERYRNIGSEIVRTNEDGAIVITTDGKEIRYRGVKTGKEGTLKF
jgi:competence protein ComEC